ncbi:hypothetical protein QWJ34_06055 [Saccharibacillus sp. CPCC 101409]|uniref:hypothetical protein n=1 Tax=Saccharibacillus sp. CPCC 101409 TaxID=3058041 RepID=UPI002671E24E|nr:hypothetical protein [Saccharibacillus sp. CPCC 101409]MDO3409319.1 hypothetical protein [Saccharibacillus sp. CPCC 101409]
MNLNALSREGEELRDKVASAEDFRRITQWLSTAAVYLEARHKNLKETASFIAEKDKFKAQVLNEEKYSLLLFDSLLGTLKAIEMLEEMQTKEQTSAKTGARNWNDF